MAYTVTKGTVSHNGREYRKGEEIEITEILPGESNRLIRLGIVEGELREETEEENSAPPTSVEAFSALSASDQKATLKKLSIDPAANAEERIKQFAAWQESKGK